jgi:phosphoketolase
MMVFFLYRSKELFDEQGRLKPELVELAPSEI